MEHSLRVDTKVKPRKKRLLTMSEDRKKAAQSEVQKLQDTGVIREVQYPEWLANVVMVPKKNGSWRMCIDFTTLNKFCPKDEFPLPRIDTLVDEAAGSEMLSMLDCFSDYHQIFMKKSDEEKTSFTTPFGTYCYVRIPEGLCNAGCTFNRTIAAVLDTQLDRNISAYVDDVIVRSKKARRSHLKYLRDLRKHRLKLNPEKCVFGIRRGKLLGCMITESGIEANLVKIEAIRRMQPPTTNKEVQKLTGRLASLNRFISRSAKKSLPFFKVLKGSENFHWGPEQDKAFEELKQYLENLAVMTRPSPGAELLLYIATSSSAVSAALVEERMVEENLKQLPIYFVSEALSGSKLLYSKMEKMAYAVVMAARKLRHYFQSFKINVPTFFPLRDMFESREVSGRIGKWAT
jgi:hypothetical protein